MLPDDRRVFLLDTGFVVNAVLAEIDREVGAYLGARGIIGDIVVNEVSRLSRRFPRFLGPNRLQRFIAEQPFGTPIEIPEDMQRVGLDLRARIHRDRGIVVPKGKDLYSTAYSGDLGECFLAAAAQASDHGWLVLMDRKAIKDLAGDTNIAKDFAFWQAVFAGDTTPEHQERVLKWVQAFYSVRSRTGRLTNPPTTGSLTAGHTAELAGLSRIPPAHLVRCAAARLFRSSLSPEVIASVASPGAEGPNDAGSAATGNIIQSGKIAASPGAEGPSGPNDEGSAATGHVVRQLAASPGAEGPSGPNDEGSAATGNIIQSGKTGPTTGELPVKASAASVSVEIEVVTGDGADALVGPDVGFGESIVMTPQAVLDVMTRLKRNSVVAVLGDQPEAARWMDVDYSAMVTAREFFASRLRDEIVSAGESGLSIASELRRDENLFGAMVRGTPSTVRRVVAGVTRDNIYNDAVAELARADGILAACADVRTGAETIIDLARSNPPTGMWGRRAAARDVRRNATELAQELAERVTEPSTRARLASALEVRAQVLASAPDGAEEAYRTAWLQGWRETCSVVPQVCKVAELVCSNPFDSKVQMVGRTVRSLLDFRSQQRAAQEQCLDREANIEALSRVRRWARDLSTQQALVDGTRKAVITAARQGRPAYVVQELRVHLNHTPDDATVSALEQIIRHRAAEGITDTRYALGYDTGQTSAIAVARTVQTLQSAVSQGAGHRTL